MVSHELSERSRRLLAALVREYIATGEPVPSQTLARESGLGVSSATIRNLFARLEADGYVHQPHTSAGRVPTDRGYRVFVDLLLESRKPTRPTAIVEHELRQHAERSPLIDDLLISVSHMVSRASKHVGFAIGSTEIAVLQRIEFVPLGGTRVLVVVVSRGNQVTQKVVDAGEDIRSDDLAEAEVVGSGEEGNLLRLASVNNGEIVMGKILDGVAPLVRDHDVDVHQPGSDSQSGVYALALPRALVVAMRQP